MAQESSFGERLDRTPILTGDVRKAIIETCLSTTTRDCLLARLDHLAESAAPVAQPSPANLPYSLRPDLIPIRDLEIAMGIQARPATESIGYRRSRVIRMVTRVACVAAGLGQEDLVQVHYDEAATNRWLIDDLCISLTGKPYSQLNPEQQLKVSQTTRPRVDLP